MGPIKSVKSCMFKFADINGRATRSEYWWFYLFIIIGTFTSAFIDFGTIEIWKEPIELPPVTATFILITAIPYLAVTIRRLHDAGLSGWYFWVILIPFVGGLVLTFLMILPSTGRNRFGAPPAYAAPRPSKKRLAEQQASAEAARQEFKDYYRKNVSRKP